MKTTTAIITIAPILMIVGTTLAPILQQEGDATSSRHPHNADSIDHGINHASVKDKSQHLNQENICYRSNICNNSNVAQLTLGNDNRVTGFADQSENNSPKANLTAGAGS